MRSNNNNNNRSSSISNVIRATESRRIAHIGSIYSFTRPLKSTGERVVRHTSLQYETALWLAWKHVRDGEGFLVPGIKGRLETCDIDFTLTMMDTQISGFKAVEGILGLLQAKPPPAALIGDTRSSVSMTSSIISGALDIPQVSPLSTSPDLDNKEFFPRFARLIPSDTGNAQALVQYYHHAGVEHLIVLYVDEPYGRHYKSAIATQCAIWGIRVLTVPVLPFDADSIEHALEVMVESQVRTVFGALHNEEEIELVLLRAYHYKLVGNANYFWTFGEGAVMLVEDADFGMDLDERYHDSDEKRRILSLAWNGVGVLSLADLSNPSLVRAFEEFSESPEQQHLFARQHPEAHILFPNLNASTERDVIFPMPPVVDSYATFSYDTMIAIALAACECPYDLFTGSELYEQLLKTTFAGVSGRVTINNNTGSRRAEDFRYVIKSVQYTGENNSATNFVSFTSDVVHLHNATVTQPRPFVYFDGSTNRPDSLPPLHQDLLLIPDGARAVGWVFAGLAMLSSIACCSWISWSLTRRRSRRNVREAILAGQPLFLRLICLGCFLTSVSVIFLSLQEPVSQTVLNVSCMMGPWFLAIGTGLAISALVAKLLRILLLFQSDGALRRRVTTNDVAAPIVVVLIVNIALMAAWTAAAPLSWQRIPLSYDQWGRVTESYGLCNTAHQQQIGRTSTAQWDTNTSVSGMVTPYSIALVAVNGSVFLGALYLAYKTRKVPARFNEAQNVSVSMFLLTECFLVGLPVVVLANDDPTALFVVMSVMISLGCMFVLYPIFLPICYKRFDRERTSIHISGVDMAPGSTRRSLKNRCSYQSNESGESSRLSRPSPNWS